MQCISSAFELVQVKPSEVNQFYVAPAQSYRPCVDCMAGYKPIAEELQSVISASMQRKSCPVQWVSWHSDESGVLMLVGFKKAISYCNAKTVLKTLLKATDMKDVIDKLEPLDILHSWRLAKWLTPTLCTREALVDR